MEKTICAISTNVGSNGAISIVRMSGADAVNITSKIFSSLKFDKIVTYRDHCKLKGRIYDIAVFEKNI